MTALLFAFALQQSQGPDNPPPDATKEERFVWWVHREDIGAFKKAALELGVNAPPTINEWATPLAYVAWVGDVKELHFLLEQGAKVDGPCKDGATPLMLACRDSFSLEGESPKVEALIHAGANINARDNKGATPLHYAASWPNYDIYWDGQAEAYVRTMDFLVKHGAKADAPDNNGMSPLHYAAEYGHFGSIQRLLELGADPKRLDKFNRSPLTFTLRWGSDNRDFDALKRAGSPIGPVEYVLMGEIDTAIALLKGGTEGLAFGPNGESPLALAAKTGRVDLVEAILPYKTDVNHVDDRGETAMLAATGVGFSFSQLGADHSYDPSKEGNREQIVALLKSVGGDPSFAVPSESKYSLRPVDETPLYRAVCTGNIELVKAFLNAGAKLDGAGVLSPLGVASAMHRLDLVELLLKSGADPSAGYPVRELLSGSVPVEETMGHDESKVILARLIAAKSTLRFPDQYRGAKEMTDTAAHHAVSDVECLRMVLDAGVDLDQQDGYGETPLMRAASYGKIESVKELLRRGANRTLKSKNGSTALAIAKNAGDQELIDILSG